MNLKESNVVIGCPIIPDTLSLSEALEYFKINRVDFAVVMNEYALVVGVVTFNDLQSAVMALGCLPKGKSKSSRVMATHG